MKKKLYFENLDGLRFLCFLSVFFYHSFYTENEILKQNPIYHFVKSDLFGNGNIGVNFFFVLSGFLITFLLVEEKKLCGQINLKKFWIRRILRIWPLFYLCVFYGFLIFPMLKEFFGQISNETANPIYYLTFTNNFDFINKGLPDASNLGVLWSVAIEEQFYLLWPIVVFVFPIKRLWIPFLIIITGSLIFRASNDSYIYHECHTLSCIGDMAIGATGAWLINISDRFKKFIKMLPKFYIILLYIMFFSIYLFRKELMLENNILRIFERMIIAVLIIFIILEQTYSLKSFYKMSDFKGLTKLGIITYGLYCLHFIGILITLTLTKKLSLNVNLWEILLLETSVSLILTILISKLSYRFFELPFLNMKERFSIITKSQ